MHSINVLVVVEDRDLRNQIAAIVLRAGFGVRAIHPSEVTRFLSQHAHPQAVLIHPTRKPHASALPLPSGIPVVETDVTPSAFTKDPTLVQRLASHIRQVALPLDHPTPGYHHTYFDLALAV